MSEIEEAIKAIEFRKWEHELFGDHYHFFDVAIQTLHEKAERDKGCEYCTGDTKELIDGETTVFITGDDKVFCADWGGDGYLDWILCPMCGRKLVGE